MQTSISYAGNKGDKIRSDCFVSFEPGSSGGIRIELKSKVAAYYGKSIMALAESMLHHFDVKHAVLTIEDSGALPFVLMARIEHAVRELVKDVKPYLPEILPGNMYETAREAFRFSRLYLPGNTPSMMINAGIHHPNGIILDLEDSVAPPKKDEARLIIRNALRALNFYGAERMVRINQGARGIEDLQFIVQHPLNCILIPKCESAAYIQQIDAEIERLLPNRNSERKIWYMPIIESALGIEKAFEIATASPNVVALAIGLEDFTADLGVSRTLGAEESLYARTRLINACKAAGIQPIDSVFSDVADMEGLLLNVKKSKSLGFEGMGCIHPRQIQVIHEGFAPEQSEIEKAQKIMLAWFDAREKGLGVVSLGSKMIDPPVVKRAEKTIHLSIQLGLIRSDWKDEMNIL